MAEELPFPPFHKDDAFHDLQTQLRGPRPPLAFVGAGASVASGHVAWPKLLQAMREAAGDQEGNRLNGVLDAIDDAPWTAEVHRKAMGPDAFRDLITRLYQPGPVAVAEPHVTLASMPFRHFLTTNYDSCIERALAFHRTEVRVVNWTDEAALSRFLIEMASPNMAKTVLYLHGRYDRIDDIVLTESSYVQRYITSDDARRKLLAIFMTHPVVFVGFSMSDPDFANLMREVTARLRTHPPCHYVIMGYSSLEEKDAYALRMTEKFGVRPVFFSRKTVGGDSYDNLMLLLQALVEPKNKAALPAALTEKLQAAVPSPRRDPADPQKGRWGGKAEDHGLRLGVSLVHEKGNWVRFQLAVEPTDGRPLSGEVRFHLHPTFPRQVELVMAAGNKAVLELSSYGAFTVGAEILSRKACLELDLALQSTLPKKWRQR